MCKKLRDIWVVSLLKNKVRFLTGANGLLSEVYIVCCFGGSTSTTAWGHVEGLLVGKVVFPHCNSLQPRTDFIWFPAWGIYYWRPPPSLNSQAESDILQPLFLLVYRMDPDSDTFSEHPLEVILTMIMHFCIKPFKPCPKFRKKYLVHGGHFLDIGYHV